MTQISSSHRSLFAALCVGTALSLFSALAFSQPLQNCEAASCSKKHSASVKQDAISIYTGDRLPLKNSEQLNTGLPIQRESVCQTRQVCYRTTRHQKAPRIAIDNAIEAVRFASGKHYIPDSYIDKLRTLLESFAGKQDLRLQFVGHTDNERLSANAKRIYNDNMGLSIHRAREVMRHVQKKLGLPDRAVSYDGRAFHEPIALNDSKQSMALNRRVEVIVSHAVDNGFDENTLAMDSCSDPSIGRVDTVNKALPLLAPAQVTPWKISIDGQPFKAEQGLHIADIQRCNDVALENSRIQIQFDSGNATPSLNVAAWQVPASKFVQIDFKAWTNYPAWINKAEIRISKQAAIADSIFEVDAAMGEELLDILPLNAQRHTSWQGAKQLGLDQLYYRLRVYDEQGNFDETQAQPLVNALNTEQSDAYTKAYGKNQMAVNNIRVRGGTVTVSGLDVPSDHSVWIFDQKIPADQQGNFVAEHIVPHGFHTASVALLDSEGSGQKFWRDLRIKNNDWFYVGIADFTYAESDHSGAIDLVRADDVYDESGFGRLAFYTKGNFGKRYTLTGRVDTGEEPLDKLFKNIDERDPRSLLRRMDAEDGFTTFGDDSATVDDTPTQGKFYLKLEDDRSHAMWGNQSISIDGNELAQIHRGLYGFGAKYSSERSTIIGDPSTQLQLFAAAPDTVPAHEEFQSTGGSLYYLQHRDLTLGSEQLRVETRDKDTGFVLASTRLKLGKDYDIDELQGTLLLTHPLSSYSTQLNAGSLVRTASYNGHPAYLVVDYEYQPALTDVDAMNVGGRASHWLGDVVQLGVSANHQANDNAADQSVAAADITVQASSNTWLKYSQGYSEGPGSSEIQSADGGFEFNAGNSVNTDANADAQRVEFRLDGQDIGIHKSFVTTAYWQDREAGYSSLAQQAQDDTQQLGVNTQIALSDAIELAASHTQSDIDGSSENQASEVDLHINLTERWRLSAGAREDQQHNGGSPKQNRSDALLRLAYQKEHAWQAYLFGQDTYDIDDGRVENDRYGVGGQWQIGKRVVLNAEYSEGELGDGALLGVNYQPSQKSSYYLNYAIDADEPARGISNGASQNTTNTGNVVLGTKTRFSDSASVYAEERYAYGDQAQGLTQAYGVDLAFDDRWTYGVNLEHGDLDTDTQGEIKRLVAGLQLGYSHNDVRYAGAIEYREDESATQHRDSWLLRNTLKYQIDDDWRFISRFDYAFSDSSEGDFFDGDYIEGVVGYGYRPVEHSRWNNLFTYTYLFDKTSSEQLNRAEQSIDYQQRSHVAALDINYDITKRWELGGRYAYRKTELRDRAVDSGDWFESDAALYVLRLDYHLTHKWDFLIEGRLLDLHDQREQLSGALAGLYRHFGNHFKLGVGYNFSDFTDDLTDLDYDAKGFFINAVGKF